MAKAAARLKSQKNGFLDRRRVQAVAFWTTTACIFASVVSTLLAIWEFADRDALWRTVATFAVIGAGMIAFSWVNTLFGDDD